MPWAPGWKERAIKQVLFKCERCGRCCSEYKIMELFPRDLARLQHHFHMSLAQVMLTFCAEHPTAEGRWIINEWKPCKFYKNGCRIYNSRPIGCRFYPFLSGTSVLCRNTEIEVPDMDDSALWMALARDTGLAVTEMMEYLKSIGAWVDDRER